MMQGQYRNQLYFYMQTTNIWEMKVKTIPFMILFKTLYTQGMFNKTM